MKRVREKQDIFQRIYLCYNFAMIERIKERLLPIQQWLGVYEQTKELPLYSSVDIRDAGFKVAVIDTNLFPAGFNNLCEHGMEDAVLFFKKAILHRVPHCQNILIIAEEHTRNTWYLENIRILQKIIEQAGFNVKIATFLSIQPAFCQSAHSVELQTATGEVVKIFCFKKILQRITAHEEHYDLIIMNNDLSTGIPEVLKESAIPIYPSLQAGWHARLKSYHFEHTAALVQEFAAISGLDPWLFSTLYTDIPRLNIHESQDRQKLMDASADLFKKIQQKYTEHKIDEKPFLFIKDNAGTYGMGVLAIEDPQEIRDLNRHNRNRLHKGKGAHVISHYLLQEGIPTIHNIDSHVSEVVMYQVENNLIGGFYRSHPDKSSRDNLNSKGMDFKKMCPHSAKYGNCGTPHAVNIFDVYRLLARIAAIAAHREIVQLEIATG